jgi:hypothetical protein
MSEDAIRTYARRHRVEDAQCVADEDSDPKQEVRRAQVLNRRVPSLWTTFGQALIHLGDVYNVEYGQKVVAVEIRGRRIMIRAARRGHARALTLVVDIESGSVLSRLQEIHTNGVRSDRAGPNVRLVITGEDVVFASRHAAESLRPPTLTVAEAVLVSMVEEL